MEKLEPDTKYFGKFNLSNERWVTGELVLNGRESKVNLYDDEFIFLDTSHEEVLYGELFDLTKVTLINNITPGPGRISSLGKTRYTSSAFPHYVVTGLHHFDPSLKTIESVHFALDDFNKIFYDNLAFGKVLSAEKYIDKVIEWSKLDKEWLEDKFKLDKSDHELIVSGEYPEIVYFTGVRTIFKVETEIGVISATNSVVVNSNDSNGYNLDNNIYITIEFNESISFENSLDKIIIITKFFEIIAGRPQNIRNLTIQSRYKQSVDLLNVYWSHVGKRDDSENQMQPHPADILIQAVTSRKEFEKVFSAWINMNDNRHTARLRFSENFSFQYDFNHARIIGAANMFDILPSEVFSSSEQLPDNLLEAKKEARKIFKVLPESLERDSVLGELGRLGKKKLKHKIRDRVNLILENVDHNFDDLMNVTDEAVDCRNFYVHGSLKKNKPDYGNHPDLISFFTMTLEFVFALSDLIDAGWDANSWINKQGYISHPFSHYCSQYDVNIKMFKEFTQKS